VILAHTIAGILKTENILVERGATFWTGSAGPLVALLPPSRSRAPIVVSHGSCNCVVVAAESVPQAVRSSNYHQGHIAVPGTYRFSHGRLQSNEEHRKEQIVVRVDTSRKILIEQNIKKWTRPALCVLWAPSCRPYPLTLRYTLLYICTATSFRWILPQSQNTMPGKFLPAAV
jgi:hypothetical protein